MTICYVGNIDAVHTQRWAKAFNLLGHKVHVVYMGGDKNNIDELENAGVSVHLLNRGISKDKESIIISKKRSADVKKYYMRFPNKITLPLIMYLINPRRLRSLLKKIQPDILHAWYLHDSGCGNDDGIFNSTLSNYGSG